VLGVRMTDNCRFNCNFVFRFLEESFQAPSRTIDEQCLDSPRHAASCSGNS
jgi:hypothetical protein